MEVDRRSSAWSQQDWVAIVGITVAAGLLRYVRVVVPSTLVYDEAFYVQDACRLALGAADTCHKWVAPISEVHPPLGKWLIAAGMNAFGYTPLGWRIGAAAAGTLTVAFLYLLARRLLRSTAGAALASSLLAIDPLHFVHSRLGMLDIFVPFFTTAALLFCVYDRDDILRRRATHPWRLAAGIAAGATIATKWPGAFVLVMMILLVLRWELIARGVAGPAGLFRVLQNQGLSIAASLLIVPALVYAASYTWMRPLMLLTGAFWKSFAGYHAYLWQYHEQLGGASAAQSPPWMWLLPSTPLWYFHEYAQHGCRTVAAFASPLWLLALVPIGLMLFGIVRRRKVEDAEAVIVLGFALSYLPWLLVARNRAATYLFYVLPTVPFFCLALAHLIRSMRRTLVVWTLLSVVFFAVHYPRMTAVAHLERLPGHDGVCAGRSVYPP